MARPSELAQLEARRQSLAAEGEVLRRHLAAETAHLQAATAWVQTGYTAFQSIRPWWPVLVAVIGFFFARKPIGALKSAGKLWSWWRIAQKLFRLWRRFSSKTSSAEDDTALHGTTAR